MKRAVLLLVLGLLSSLTTSWAQGVAKLLILSEHDRKPLTDVICKAYDEAQKVKGYRLSNRDGEVQFSTEGLSYLVCTKLGYKSVRIDIRADYSTTVYLQEQITELREVVVKSKPLEVEGDTIHFNASRFLSQSDRYLEDLIAKMPGLSVDAGGRIRYQGQYIRRMYIEGKDMLGSDYNVAAKTLQAEGIAQVQVLENHQHIRRLKGKVYEDRASINIKLKKSHQNRLLGDFAIGGAKLTPLVGLLEAKLSHFSSKYQGLYILQANSSGDAYVGLGERELNINNVEVYDLGSKALGGDSYQTLSELELKRYLDNRSASTSMSGLLSLDSCRLVKYTLQSMLDNRRQTSSDKRLLGGAMSALWERFRAYDAYDRGVSLKMNFEQNSTKRYLTNELRLDKQSNRSLTNVSINSKAYQQNAEQGSCNIENILSTSFPLLGNDIIYKGLVRFYYQPESISMKGVDPDVLSLAHSGFTLNNHLSTLWSLSKGVLSLGLTERYKRQSYRAGEATSLLSSVGFSLSPGYVYHYARGMWSVSLSPKIEYAWGGKSLMTAKPSSRLLYTLAPSFRWRHDWTSKIQLSLNLSQDSNFETSPYPFLGVLRTNYWNYYGSPSEIYSTSVWKSYIGLSYKDIYRGLFGNINASYKLRKQEYILNHVYEATRYIRAYRADDNFSNQWSVALGIDKTWVDAGFTIKYNVLYQQSRYRLMQTEMMSNAMSANLAHSLKGVLRANNSISARAEIEYSHWWLSSSLHKAMTNLSRIKTYAHIDMLPIKQWQCNLGIEGYWNEIGGGVWTKGLFLDFSSTYRINKQLELSLACTNLLNRKTYQVEYVQALNSESFSVPLRGREVLLRVNYRL